MKGHSQLEKMPNSPAVYSVTLQNKSQHLSRQREATQPSGRVKGNLDPQYRGGLRVLPQLPQLGPPSAPPTSILLLLRGQGSRAASHLPEHSRVREGGPKEGHIVSRSDRDLEGEEAVSVGSRVHPTHSI